MKTGHVMTRPGTEPIWLHGGPHMCVNDTLGSIVARLMVTPEYECPICDGRCEVLNERTRFYDECQMCSGWGVVYSRPMVLDAVV